MNLLGATVVIGAWLLSAAADPMASIRAYEIPGHGILELTVPTGWKEEVRRPVGRPPTITLVPVTGDSSKLLITPGWQTTSEQGFNTPPKIRELLERQGQGLIGSAIEERLVLEELRGPYSVGYFYSLTDKAPKPGEYAYMTQGAVGVGRLLVVFTFLFREKHLPERQAGLEIIRTARHKLK